MEKVKEAHGCGKLIVRDGWLVCPGCHKRLLRVEPNTAAQNLIVYCRNCKRTATVDIDRGQCFESQSPT